MMTVSSVAPAEQLSIDWQQLVLGANADGLHLIERLARRRFNAGVMAEEAANYVLERLSEDNWKRCASFKGNSKPTTFLQSMIVNLLEEFSRNRFGRPRPPVWLQRQGELWVKLWKELCLERQPLGALVSRYEQNGLHQGSWIQRVARVIKARIPRCGEYRFEAGSADDSAEVETLADNSTPVDLCGYEFELKAESELILVLQALMQEDHPTNRFDATQAKRVDREITASLDRLGQLRKSLSLSDEETVMLRMIFCDGLSRTAASRALGLPSHKAGQIVNAALSRMRSAVNLCDLNLDSLLGKV